MDPGKGMSADLGMSEWGTMDGSAGTSDDSNLVMIITFLCNIEKEESGAQNEVT